MKLGIYSKLERVKSFIKFFVEKYQPRCCFCRIKMDWIVFFPKLSRMERDDWTEHHLDHNRKNQKPNNRALSHRNCHRTHHRNEQLFKEENPKKKFIYRAYLDNDTKKMYKV